MRDWVKPKWTKPRSWLIAIAIFGAAAPVYIERITVYNWFFGVTAAPATLVSSDIEAHHSVLGFKTSSGVSPNFRSMRGEGSITPPRLRDWTIQIIAIRASTKRRCSLSPRRYQRRLLPRRRAPAMAF